MVIAFKEFKANLSVMEKPSAQIVDMEKVIVGTPQATLLKKGEKDS